MDAVVNPISRELQGLLDENKHTSYGPALAELVQVFYQAKRGEDQKLLEVLRKIVPVLVSTFGSCGGVELGHLTDFM